MNKAKPAPSKPVRKQGNEPARAVVPKPRALSAPTTASFTGLAVADESALLADLRSLIGSARQRIAAAAFATQTMLCWHLGRRLLSANLQGARAEYGQQILVTVSQQLSWSHFHALLRQRLYRVTEHARERAGRRMLYTEGHA